MTPQLTLDRALDPAEAADWLSRIAPARQTDLMANSPLNRASGTSKHCDEQGAHTAR